VLGVLDYRSFVRPKSRLVLTCRLGWSFKGGAARMLRTPRLGTFKGWSVVTWKRWLVVGILWRLGAQGVISHVL